MNRSGLPTAAATVLIAAALVGCSEQDRQIAHCKNVANVLIESEGSSAAYTVETVQPEQTDNRRKWVTVSKREIGPAPVAVQVRCEYNAGQDAVQAAAIYVIGQKLELPDLAAANVSAIELMHQ